MNSFLMLCVGVLVFVTGVFSAPAPDTGLNGLHIANGGSTITGLSGPLAPPEPFPPKEESDPNPVDQVKSNTPAAGAESLPGLTVTEKTGVEVGHVHPNAEEEASHFAPAKITTGVAPSSATSSSPDGQISQSPKDLETANTFLLGLGLLKLGALGFYGGYGFGYGYGYPGLYGGYPGLYGGYGHPGVYPGGLPPY